MRAVLGNKRGSAGQVLPATAILMSGLLAMTGLVLDGGMIYQVKRRMQTAADAAALGGAHELYRGNSSLVESGARADSSLNGFTHNVNSTVVTVYNPPLNGPWAGNNLFVEVIVTRVVPTTFLRVVSRQFSTVKSRAVAGLVKYTDACVIALDPDDRGALTVGGTSNLTSYCGVAVNSADSSAIETQGGGCIYSDEVGVSGGATMNGIADCILPNGASPGMPPMLDPLAYMQAQAPAKPLIPLGNNFKISGGTAVILPGLYTGGIEITGGNVTFLPGVYYLDGGGLKITGSPIVRGDGVTFYNTKTGGGQWGQFDLEGTGQMDFKAPNSGPYEGMLFWTDPACPNIPSNYSTITGTSDSRFEGVIYVPSTRVNYSGTSTSADWTMLVANTINIVGTTNVTGDFAASNTSPPTRKATLVE